MAFVACGAGPSETDKEAFIPTGTAKVQSSPSQYAPKVSSKGVITMNPQHQALLAIGAAVVLLWAMAGPAWSVVPEVKFNTETGAALPNQDMEQALARLANKPEATGDRVREACDDANHCRWARPTYAGFHQHYGMHNIQICSGEGRWPG